MNDQKSLSISLGAVQFAMWELRLYLDTHPEDVGALKLYNRYEDKYHVLRDEYEKKYGPLMSDESTPGIGWLKNPWPWDYEGGGC